MKKQTVVKQTTLCLVIAAALAGGLALAKGGLTLSDTDGDGVISAEEITLAREAKKASVLLEFDTDGNGELSRNERRAMQDARYEEMLTVFDADGDGELSRQERRAASEAQRAATVSMLDVNGDGELSAEESAGMDQLKAERGDHKHGKRAGKRGGDRDSRTDV